MKRSIKKKKNKEEKEKKSFKTRISLLEAQNQSLVEENCDLLRILSEKKNRISDLNTVISNLHHIMYKDAERHFMEIQKFIQLRAAYSITRKHTNKFIPEVETAHKK